MKYILSGKVLIIPDSHTQLNWVDSILAKESFDHVVFAGDYFDSRGQIDNITNFSEKRICEWINQKFVELGKRAIWLIGNHDLIRIGNYSKKSIPYHFPKFPCSQWTRNKQKDFNRKIDPNWIKNLDAFCIVGDYLISHAGLHSYYLKNKSLEELDSDWQTNKLNLPKDHWIGDCGYVRGGSHNFGGPCWLDWSEFAFDKNNQIKQIFGHNRFEEVIEFKGSYCIDTTQTDYGVWEDGVFSTKRLDEKDYLGYLE